MKKKIKLNNYSGHFFKEFNFILFPISANDLKSKLKCPFPSELIVIVLQYLLLSSSDFLFSIIYL